jgi:hypothetical protein
MEDQKVNLWNNVEAPGYWRDVDKEDFPDPNMTVYLMSLRPQLGKFNPNDICWSAGFEDEEGAFGPTQVPIPLKEALMIAAQYGWQIHPLWALPL